MASPSNPLLKRVQAGLVWPDWSQWAEATEPADVSINESIVTRGADRLADVELRLSAASSVSEGGAYLKIFDDSAREQATHDHSGPLAGYTFAIKDLVAVKGEPVTAGSEVRAHAASEPRSAPIVDALEQLGAIAMGRVTLHEFAFGVTGVNPHTGTPTNPAAPERVPGGSSSGSAAAVAEGSARIAIGTDTGGSVRIPAAFCGVVGYKPSFGTYPSAGVFPLSATLDHVGMFATSVGDIIEVHTALGHEVPAVASETKRFTLGIARADVDAADDEVREAIEQAIDRLSAAGCDVVDVGWPDAEQTFVASTAIMFSEAAAIHEKSLAAAPNLYGADIKARLQLGADLSGPEVAAAHRLRRQLIDEVTATMSGVAAILSPTTPVVAPLLADAGDPSVAPRVVANTRLGNVVGLPGISLPLVGDGPPVGLQLLGHHDASLLATAAAVEAILAD